MKISFFIKNLFPVFALLFLITSCKKKIIAKEADNTIEIKRLINKGKYYFDSFKNDSAIYCFDQSISLCKPIENYIDDYVYSLTLKANILQNNGDFYGSEAEITKTLPYLKKTSKPKFKNNDYTITAYNYYHNYDFKNALLYHRKALKLADTPFKKSVISADIAILYLNQKKYKEAINLLETLIQKKAKHESDSVRTVNHHSLLLNNLGYCYMETKNPKALMCLEKSLELILPLNDYYELIGTYNILAAYHEKNQNLKLAKFYAEKAYYNSVKGKAQSLKADCLARLIKLSKGKTLKNYSQLYVSLIDSITDARKIYKNQSSNIKYDFKKNKEKNLELKTQKTQNELEIQRQKNRSFISYITITISIISLIFIALYKITKGKTERNNEAFRNETRISKKLESELKKDIDKILFFTGNYDLEKEENKEKFISYLNNIYIKTRKISRENSAILTDDNYVEGLKEMISGYTSSDLNIIVNGLNSFSWSKIDRIKKITVFRVLQEIFDNMNNFNSASLVSITFKKDSKNIFINYADNSSKSLHHEIKLSSHFANIENRLKSIKGDFEISLNSNLGFNFFIKLPL